MRTVETKVYTFAELSDKAKDRAIQDYASLVGYVNADEAMNSIQALAQHFGGKVTDYDIAWFATSHSSMTFQMPDMTKTEIRRRLKELGDYNKATGKGLGDCKLTGGGTDEDAIDGFRAAFKAGETNLEALMQAAFQTWLAAGQADCEDFYSYAQFGEHCQANNDEFLESGEAYEE